MKKKSNYAGFEYKSAFKILFIITISILQLMVAKEISAQIKICGARDVGSEEMQELRGIYEQWLLENDGPNFNVIITIPVAFHVIRYNDGSADVTNTQINVQLNVLNNGFQNTNMRFSLYSIQRVNNTPWTQHSLYSQEEIQMKQNLAIYPSNVLNFYICAEPKDEYGNELAGYAHFPWDFPENSTRHGVVVRNTCMPFGSQQGWNEGDIGTHEVGHFAGLFHTFQNGCIPPGDEVDDTPYEDSPAYYCPVGRNTCPEPGDDPIHNFMNYTDDGCKTHFTPGQSSRIDEKMQQYRPSMYYSPVQVTVDQKRESGQLMNGSDIGKWHKNNLYFEEFNVPIPPFNFVTNTQEVLRGKQNLIENPHEKYYGWKANDVLDRDVRNHHIFNISSDITNYISQFKKTFGTVTLKNNLEGTTFIGGDIQFFDPWYIDFQDGAYGNSWRNRGMEEPNQFYNRSVGTNGWQPDLTTVYQQGPHPYNGVFLNQGWPNWQPPYYSVKANLTQDITLYNTGNLSGRSHKFYFRNWDYDENKISLKTPGSNETTVVFKTPDAELSANLKGTNLSDDQKAYNTTSQRKFIKTPDGYLHSVYSSLGRVWYEQSPDNGASWFIISQQPLDDGEAKLPSIDYALIKG